MHMEPDAAERCPYLVVRAMRLLAGYGVFLNASTERSVCRLLDHLVQAQDLSPASLVGTFVSRKVDCMAKYCRVYVLSPMRCGEFCTPCRHVVYPLKPGVKWITGEGCPPPVPYLLNFAQRPLWPAKPSPPPTGAPNASSSMRSRDLLLHICLPSPGVLFGAGYGWESVGIHAAELMGMLSALRWCRVCDWTLLVLDRSSLFPLLAVEFTVSSKSVLARSCQHLVSRVHAVIRALKSAWSNLVPMPCWRSHQLSFPGRWNVQQDSHGRSITLCRIAFAEHGLVGIDVKSHQTDSPIPNSFIVQGNESQDTQCGEACNLPCPADVWWPSGGPAFQLSFEGKAISNPSRAFFRRLLRTEAVAKWKQRTVQGKLASVSGVFRPGLDIRLFTRFQVPAKWHRWLLPSDTQMVDISAFAYRCVRLEEAGRSGCISDTRLLDLAQRWSDAEGFSHRTCPLCRALPGTPRHVVMSSPAMLRLFTRPLPSTFFLHGLSHPQMMMAGVGRSSRHGTGWYP
ncbi:unnamed protein product [Symbiodinium sp. CCMP2592]|nr:unnamed protein product [Symbiodinium sp. CCMP2592]